MTDKYADDRFVVVTFIFVLCVDRITYLKLCGINILLKRKNTEIMKSTTDDLHRLTEAVYKVTSNDKL